MNVQDECIKIHSQYGMSEMANYKIQLLFDSEIEKVKKLYEEKLHKAISALKIEIDYPECNLTNSRGDTFTFENNSRNEGLIDFLSLHEEGLKSFL